MLRSLDWFARGTIACALASTLLFAPVPLEAQRTAATSVTIRDVSVRSDPTLTGPLRGAVEDALRSVDLGSRSRSGFVLDVSVTRLTAHPLAVGERVDCEVSIIVEDARRHTVRGILTGRAHVIGDTSDALAEAAVRAAARGAMRSLPTAITTN